MERLSFAVAQYSALESAIHLARYLPARSLCPGAHVLDVACGEGYGSEFMARWGAASVLGVDVSVEAVRTANATFGSSRVAFRAEDVAHSTSLLNKYDLIVSLETIEHVSEPRTFLASLKEAVSSAGHILISCPNDHWYFRKGGANPFHKSRWTFEEFRRLTEEILGPASSWSLGTFCVGFSSSPWEPSLREEAPQGQIAMRKAVFLEQAALVPSEQESKATPENASYFLGLWGPRLPQMPVFCGYPISMEVAEKLWSDEQEVLQSEVVRLRAECERLKAEVQTQTSRSSWRRFF